MMILLLNISSSFKCNDAYQFISTLLEIEARQQNCIRTIQTFFMYLNALSSHTLLVVQYSIPKMTFLMLLNNFYLHRNN